MRPNRVLWTLCLCLLTLPCFTQTGAKRMPVPRGDLSTAPADEDDARDRLARDMAKKANEERQAALKNDADKLLKMALELKTYVDKSNEHLLSLEVVKKAEAIEKLAHSVKEKMKGPN